VSNRLKTVVKKWNSDKGYGFLDNGQGPDILVKQSDLLNCRYLKTRACVEFECHITDKKLVAKKVKLIPEHARHTSEKTPFRFGVMT